MSLSREQKLFLKRIRWRNLRVLIIQISICVLFLGAWEFCSRKGIINSFIFSSPSSCLRTLKSLYLSGDLFGHIFTTLRELFVSFGLGIVLGLGIAIVLYMLPFVKQVVDPFLTMLNSLPKVALGPILIIWFGANMRTIIVMALLINLIVSVVTILNGFYSIDPIKLRLLETFRASKWQVMWFLILPGSLPTIMAAIKLNISMSLIGRVHIQGEERLFFN